MKTHPFANQCTKQLYKGNTSDMDTKWIYKTK